MVHDIMLVSLIEAAITIFLCSGKTGLGPSLGQPGAATIQIMLIDPL